MWLLMLRLHATRRAHIQHGHGQDASVHHVHITAKNQRDRPLIVCTSTLTTARSVSQNMAQITKIQAADRTVTQVRGRVMRKFEKVRGERPASKERRRVCVLSVGSAYMLEQYEIGEPCYGAGCRHVHLTREAVEAQIAAGTLRWVGRERNVAAHMDVRCWKPVMSGGMKVMQLVEAGA